MNNNLFNLKGKVAVVTGASSGLGKRAAIAYANYGADVVLLARRLEKLEEVKQEITKIGRACLTIKCDITKKEEVKEAVNTIINKFGHIDILLNNAGIAIKGGVDNLEESEWDKSFNTNVKGIYLMSKYIVPHMKEKHYGKIVNISSVNAVIADKEDIFIRHSYNASKSAVLGLTKAMACSYAKYGITVNAIGPGLFETEMTENTLFKSDEFLNIYNKLNPSNRPGYKEEVNGTIIYLSSDASSYVQGQFIIIDGGASLV